MPAIPFPQTLGIDPRNIESRQVLSTNPSPRYPTLLPPTTPEELTLRLLGVRSPTQSDGRDYAGLVGRQSENNLIYGVETFYQYGGPAPAAVVGIVLGSVAGFLILIWLLYAVSNGGTFIRTTGDIEEVETVRSRTKSRRARSRREVKSRSGTSPQRVYRSERIVRDFPPSVRSRSPSVMRERDRSRMRETIIVEESRPERRVEGDDIIEVMEEHSSIDAPRRKSRRQSDRSVMLEDQVSEDDNRASRGYRTIDPRRFGGGSFRPHQI